jgi:hypothetical protein
VNWTIPLRLLQGTDCFHFGLILLFVDWRFLPVLIVINQYSAIAICLGGRALAAIFRTMCVSFKYFGAGLPDLLLLRVVKTTASSVSQSSQLQSEFVDLNDWLGSEWKHLDRYRAKEGDDEDLVGLSVEMKSPQSHSKFRRNKRFRAYSVAADDDDDLEMIEENSEAALVYGNENMMRSVYDPFHSDEIDLELMHSTGQPALYPCSSFVKQF